MLKPVTGLLLFLPIAAPWHILCGIYNPDQGHPIGNHPTLGNVHGFFYFYFVNEHFLRFFGLRYPHDYNKLPGVWYWLAHLVWLFPWSLFLPAALVAAWKTRRNWLQHLRRDAGQTVDFYLDNAIREDVASYVARLKFRVRTIWLLACSPPGRCSSSPSPPTRSTTPSRSGRRCSSSSPAWWPALKRTARRTALPTAAARCSRPPG